MLVILRSLSFFHATVRDQIDTSLFFCSTNSEAPPLDTAVGTPASASVTDPVVTRRGRVVKPPRKLSEATESQDERTESNGKAGTSGGSPMARPRRARGTTSPPVAPYAGLDSLTHSLTHSLTQSRTHALTHALTHSFVPTPDPTFREARMAG